MKLLKCAFKLPFLLSTVLLDFVKNIVVPGQNLMIWLFIVFILDFITGIIKAYIKKDEITSKKMRDSIGKMLQYSGLIMLVIIMANATFKDAIANAGFIIDGIFMLAILIETRSIAENFKEMAPDSTITKLILNPLLLVFERQTKALNDKISSQQTTGQQETQMAPPTVKLIVVFALLVPMFSCNAVQKSKSTSSTQTSYSNALQLDSARIVTLQGNTTQTLDSALKTAQTNSIHKGVKFSFDQEDTGLQTLVTVSHNAGTLVIDPGGRRIASIELESDSIHAKADSLAYSVTNAASKTKTDSTHKTATVQATGTSSDKETEFIKDTKRFSAIAFIVVFIAIVLVCAAILIIHKNTTALKEKL